MRPETLCDISDATNGLRQEIGRLMKENSQLKSEVARLAMELDELKNSDEECASEVEEEFL